MFQNKIFDNIKNKKLLWVAVSCFLIILIVVLSFVFLKKYSVLFSGDSGVQNVPSNKKQEDVSPCADCARRHIDGVYVKTGEENIPPVAVVIENLPEARPQSGISHANLVYEAEAEGRITRFLAVFAGGEEVDKIGPVRSARPYFVDWARELSALFVHVGGSPEALVKIKQENIFDMNEFYQGGYFWRAAERKAPHNVYTSSGNVGKYLDKNQVTDGKYLNWKFKDDLPVEARAEESVVKVNFDLPEFRIYWEYDKENNDYLRYMNNKIHYDALDGNPVKAKNVIIQYAKAEIIDDVLRLKMEHVGDGEALLCQDGFCQKGKWNKQSGSARTRFYKEDGSEFEFNAGSTWVEVVRPEIEVEY